MKFNHIAGNTFDATHCILLFGHGMYFYHKNLILKNCSNFISFTGEDIRHSSWAG